MNGRTFSRAAAALAAGLALAAVARPEAFTSAHWKSKIEMEGGGGVGEGKGGRMPMPTDYEIWMKAGKMRLKAEAEGMKINMLRSGEDTYNWVEGQGTGMKSRASTARRGGRPTQDYVNQVDAIRAKGKRVGAEKVDGHACEVWEYEDEQGEKGKYWLAQDLNYFPVQAVRETARGKVTYHNTEIQIPVSVSDDMFAVPKNVEFRDMSEMMKSRPPSN